MAKKQSILKASKVLSVSAESKKKMEVVAKKIGRKSLFPEKVALARKTLSGVKSLPI